MAGYPILIGEMAKRKVTNKDIASTIGVAEKTAHAKLWGESDFRISEAKKIQAKFFPDIGMEALYASEPGGQAEQ